MVKGLKQLLKYIATRTAAYLATIFTGVTLTYIVVKAMPVDAVENILFNIISVTAVYDPASIELLRRNLYEILGMGGSPVESYLIFIRRVFTFDFGPSIIAYPTPASEIVFNRLPWTVGLLLTSTLTVWVTGNLLGVIAGYFRDRRFAKVLESVAITLYPIPYYIMALILIFLFAYLLRIFPLGGGISIIPEKLNLEVILNILWHSILPAASLILPGALGWSFLSSRTLTMQTLAEDYTRYAEARGLPRSHILKRYILRNILLPQTTVLALSLGGIFGGALLTEIVFTYPGVGQIAYRAIFSGDVYTLMAVLFLSIIGTATGTYLLDLLYPLIDPRVRYR
ncbi:ABC transporter permease [Candidatus Bathyarchaeota archaeon]|nr:ABC transporter permease [Candidatus Bathyarchaeota archaeon]